MEHVGTMIIYDRETHIDAERRLAVGSTLLVFRGNGPREGECMGVGVITDLDDDGGICIEIGRIEGIQPVA